MEIPEIQRRMSRAEFAKLMGVTPEWLRQLERAGRIPPARRDPGSRRIYWLSGEVAHVVERGASAAAQPAAA